MATDRQQLLAQADRALWRGDNVEAIACFRRLLELTPNDAGLLQRLGDAYARAGQENEAREVFYQLAENLWAGGLRTRSVALLRRAVKLGNPEEGLFALLGERLLAIGLSADAREPLFEAARLAERNGANDRAAKLYQQVAEIQPKDTASREGLIRLADGSGDPAARSSARISLALAKARRNDAIGAFQLVAQALDADPKGLSALSQLKELMASLGDLPVEQIPEAPVPVSASAQECWQYVRGALLERLGLGVVDPGWFDRLVQNVDRAPIRLRLWAGKIGLDRPQIEPAIRLILDAAPVAAGNPDLQAELLEGLSTLVSRDPGRQEAVSWLLKLGPTATGRLGAPAPAAAPAPALAEASLPESPPEWNLDFGTQAAILEIRAFLSQGLVDQARQRLAAIPAELGSHPEVAALKRQIPATASPRRAQVQVPAPPPVPVEAPPAPPVSIPVAGEAPGSATAPTVVIPVAAPLPSSAGRPEKPLPPARKPAPAPDEDSDFIVLIGDEEEMGTPTAPAPVSFTTDAIPIPGPSGPTPAPTGPAAPPGATPATTTGGFTRPYLGVDLASLEYSIQEVVDPGDAETAYQMALGLAEMELEDQAIPLLQQAMGAPARRVDALSLLTKIRLARGERTQAYAEALAVRRAAPKLPKGLETELLSILTRLAAEIGRLEDARKWWEQLKALDPNHPVVQHLQGKL